MAILGEVWLRNRQRINGAFVLDSRWPCYPEVITSAPAPAPCLVDLARVTAAADDGATQVNGTITGLDLGLEDKKKVARGTPWILLYCDVEWADVLEMPATTYEECEAKRKVARDGEQLKTGWTPKGSTGALWKELTGFDRK